VASSFRPPSKSLTPRDVQFITLIAFAFVILSAALYFGNLTLGSQLGGGGEFYMTWVGGRAFLFDRIEPYTAYVPAQVQDLVYDRPARVGDEPYILDIPFPILLVYFPFSLLPDPQIARAIFTVFCELALFAFAFLSLRLAEWDSPRFFSALFIAFCVLNFHVYQALLEAAPVLLLGLLYALILFALRAEMDELAGALIALSFFQWEVGGPFLLLVLLRVFYERRTRVLAGFAMLAFILLAISLLTYPGWIIPFLNAAVNNLRADFGFSTQAIFGHIWTGNGSRIALALTILLFIALGYEWNIARGADFRRFYWASCLSLAAAPLLGFRSEMENLVVLILPLAFLFAVAFERWRRIGNGLTFFLMLFTFSVPWLIYLFALPRYGRTAEEVLFLFYPVLTVLGLYWLRWWALRPPLTWLDRARLK